jgi:hypothetical protein
MPMEARLICAMMAVLSDATAATDRSQRRASEPFVTRPESATTRERSANAVVPHPLQCRFALQLCHSQD